MLAVVVLLLVACGVVFLQGVDKVLSWMVEPSVLLGLLGLNVALLLFRLYAVIDAYRIRRGAPGAGSAATASPTTVAATPPLASRPVAAGVGVALLLLLTLAPHAVAGYYTYVSHDLLTTVFVDEEEGSSPAATTSWTPTSMVPPAATSTSTTGATQSVVTTSTTQAPPETVPPIAGAEDSRITILFVGSDAGYGRTGSRADTIMVATFDLETGRVALFGIPRNTGSAPLSEEAAKVLHKKVYLDLISSLYWEARDHPELAEQGEDSGAVVLRDTVSMLLGIPIDYYAVVDMGGFVEIVDALGGVTVNVEERLWVRLSPPTPDEAWKVYDIKPGIQHLSGLEALAFARSRTGSSDYVRMGRQRCVIAALLDQSGMAEMAWKFPSLASAVKESVRTDISIDTLQKLINIRSKLKSDEMITVGFTPPRYTDGLNEMGYNILDVELVQATVQQIIEHPEDVLAAEEAETEVDTSDCWKIE